MRVPDAFPTPSSRREAGVQIRFRRFQGHARGSPPGRKVPRNDKTGGASRCHRSLKQSNQSAVAAPVAQTGADEANPALGGLLPLCGGLASCRLTGGRLASSRLTSGGLASGRRLASGRLASSSLTSGGLTSGRRLASSRLASSRRLASGGLTSSRLLRLASRSFLCSGLSHKSSLPLEFESFRTKKIMRKFDHFVDM